MTYSSGIRSARLALVLEPSPRVGSLFRAPDENLECQSWPRTVMVEKCVRLEEEVGDLAE